MYLIDTNIFLEVLLKQEHSNKCKTFLDENIDNLNISDFSIHSIGIILFKYNEENIFFRFIEDVVSNVNTLSLPRENYKEVIETRKQHALDFDDSYQFNLAKANNLSLVTLDKDFRKIKDKNIVFL